MQTIAYRHPFGEGRVDMASVYVCASFSIADPVRGELEDVDVRDHVYRRLHVLARGTIAPTLGLPLDITVGDQAVPVGAAIAGVGRTPRIRWRAPDGRVTSYALDVTDTADIDVDGDLSLARVVARARGDDRAIGTERDLTASTPLPGPPASCRCGTRP